MKLMKLLFLLFFAFNYAMEEDWLSNKQNITEYYWQQEPYIDSQEDLTKALHDIENIDDFMQLFEKSGKQEMSPTEEVIDLEAISPMTHNNKKRKTNITIEIAQPLNIAINNKEAAYDCFLCHKKETIKTESKKDEHQISYVNLKILGHLLTHNLFENYLPEQYKNNFRNNVEQYKNDFKKRFMDGVCFICGDKTNNNAHIKYHFILNDTCAQTDQNTCTFQVQRENIEKNNKSGYKYNGVKYHRADIKTLIWYEVNTYEIARKFFGINPLIITNNTNKEKYQATCPLCDKQISGLGTRPFIQHLAMDHFTITNDKNDLVIN